MTGRLRIGENGSFQLDPETGERLRGRDFTVLVAPGELIVAVEVDGVVAPPSQAMMAGDLAHIAFGEVVGLVAQARTTGVLRVSGVSGTRRVIFAEGEVRGATSERVGERLDEIIVRLGLLKPEQVEELSKEAEAGHDVGRLAVERGLLSQRDLWNATQEHVITIFQAILLESRGSFLLSDETVDAATVPGLSAEGVLMEGARRLDELRVSGDGSGDAGRVIAAYANAFRDIFATAQDAGTGDALRAAASTVFEDDPDPLHSGVFEGVVFSDTGGLPEADILRRASEAGAQDGRPPEKILSSSLSTVMLFLLFVAGEHLDPPVQQALHSRVKSMVSKT